jgi:hypothetical protein
VIDMIYFGTIPITWVPLPGADSIVNVPPTACARSRMLIIPQPVFVAIRSIFAESNPIPSSFTVSEILPALVVHSNVNMPGLGVFGDIRQRFLHYAV